MTTSPATDVPPGLAVILRPIRDYDGPEPFDAKVVARLLDVEPKTVVSWATSERLSGLKVSNVVGWRFTRIDLIEFLTARYYRARR